MSGRRSSAPIHYKAFIQEHGSETSVYDHYEFGRMLGEGAAGSTWEARPRASVSNGVPKLTRVFSRPSDGHRAIKKVLKHRVPNGSTESFMAEVELLKELDHPNICKLYEVFEDRDSIFLVMDLCSGGELFDRIADGQLGGEAEAAELILQLAHALRYCHEHRIVHRDIKPENVLFVSPEPQAPAKLIDFGISSHFKQSERLRGRAGTEAYEAPEEEYTEKCDLWSLGVLLYVMLCGYLPFGSTSAAKSAAYVMTGEDWEHVSDEAKDLVSKLLVVNPEKRLSAAEVLEHPWVTATGSSPQRHRSISKQVSQRLKRFQQTSNFRKILLLLVARHLGANDLPEVYEAFTTLDTNGDGTLSAEEFRESICKTPTSKADKDLSELFQAVDADGSGAIDYSEFIAAAIDRKLLFREDLCQQVFRSLDRDGSGKISAQDLCTLLEESDEALVDSELREEARQLLTRYDSDGDGELDIHEFMALLTQNRLRDLEGKGLGHQYRRAHSGGQPDESKMKWETCPF